MKKDEAITALNSFINTEQVSVGTFRDRFAANPYEAFEWSRDVFVAVARIKVATIALSLLTDHTVSEVYTALQRQLNFCATYPERSTSPQFNILHQDTISAYGHVLELLR